MKRNKRDDDKGDVSLCYNSLSSNELRMVVFQFYDLAKWKSTCCNSFIDKMLQQSETSPLMV